MDAFDEIGQGIYLIETIYLLFTFLQLLHQEISLLSLSPHSSYTSPQL